MLDQMIETMQDRRGVKGLDTIGTTSGSRGMEDTGSGWKREVKSGPKIEMTTEERLTRVSAEANRLRHKVTKAVEDKYDDARRAVRRGKYAAEDMIDETAYRIKRDPFRSVAVTFGVGLGLGAVIGWLGKRGRRPSAFGPREDR